MRTHILLFQPLYVLMAALLCLNLSPACHGDGKKLPVYNYGLGGTPNQIQARVIGVDHSPMSSAVQQDQVETEGAVQASFQLSQDYSILAAEGTAARNTLNQIRSAQINGAQIAQPVSPIIKLQGQLDGIFKLQSKIALDTKSLPSSYKQGHLIYEVLSISLEERHVGNQWTTAPEFTYGNAKTGLDIGLAGFLSGETGAAAAIKYDFTPSRYQYISALKADYALESTKQEYSRVAAEVVPRVAAEVAPRVAAEVVPRVAAEVVPRVAANEMISTIPTGDPSSIAYRLELAADLPMLIEAATTASTQILLAVDALKQANLALRSSLVRYNRDLQQAVYAGAHFISHTGLVTVQGVTASKLVLLSGENGLAGVTFSVLVQSVQFDDTQGTHLGRSDGQFGASVTLQDKTDYYRDKTRTDPVIHPWTWKLGGEYYGRNSLAPHEALAVFGRLRELKTRYHYEISPYYGKDAGRQQYYGVTVGMTIPLS